jgi:DNA-directed RNA polymerase specialized sigma24 family protein
MTARPARPLSDAPPAPDSIDVILASQDWVELGRRLTLYAYGRIHKRSWETAEDIAQEAIAHLLDAAYAPWDRERHPDLFDCLGHIVNGLAANHFRRKAFRAPHVPIMDDVDGAEDDAPIDPRGQRDAEEQAPPADAVVLSDRTDAAAARGEEARDAALLAELRTRLAGDALAIGLLDQIHAGEGRPKRQADVLGVSVNEVYTAKRRIFHHARAIAREMELETKQGDNE